MEYGYNEGEVCNRDGCTGIIEKPKGEGSCSCHSSPPCSYCTDSRSVCPECGWDGREEQIEAENKDTELYLSTKRKASNTERTSDKEILDAYSGGSPLDKMQWFVSKRWHSGYEATGWKPPNVTREDIIKKFGFDLPKLKINAHGGFIISGFTD